MVAFLCLCFCFFLLLCIPIKAESPPDHNGCIDHYPYDLDVGIYWSGVNDDVTDAEIRTEKSCISGPRSEWYISKYFNPRRKTIIFVHGAQPDAVKNGYFRTGLGPEWTALSAPWISLGWNIGYFHWTQFADEPLRNFERAQAKIWNTRYFSGMEYTYTPTNGPAGTVAVGATSVSEDVTEILVRHILSHDITGDLRLVGHSLGSQLVMRAAHYMKFSDNGMVNEHRIHIDPDKSEMLTRVELLDPVFSSLPEGFLLSHHYGSTIPEVIGHYAADLAEIGVTMVAYTASKINQCLKSASGVNTLLMKSVATVHVIFNEWGEEESVDCFGKELWGDPKHLSQNANRIAMQIANQHAAVVKFYLLSISSPPMRCHMSGDVCIPENSLSVSAAMPTEQVYGWHDIHDNSTGEKLCLIEFDDGNRKPDGSTMTFMPSLKHFYATPCSKLSI